MNKEFPELQKLLQMRGEDAPADEYFEEFLDEFHRRQRQDLMKRSARSLMMERITVWMREMGSRKWIYAAGSAYAVAMVAVLAWPKATPAPDPTAPVIFEQKELQFENVPHEEPPRMEPTEF